MEISRQIATIVWQMKCDSGENVIGIDIDKLPVIIMDRNFIVTGIEMNRHDTLTLVLEDLKTEKRAYLDRFFQKDLENGIEDTDYAADGKFDFIAVVKDNEHEVNYKTFDYAIYDEVYYRLMDKLDEIEVDIETAPYDRIRVVVFPADFDWDYVLRTFGQDWTNPTKMPYQMIRVLKSEPELNLLFMTLNEYQRRFNCGGISDEGFVRFFIV